MTEKGKTILNAVISAITGFLVGVATTISIAWGFSSAETAKTTTPVVQAPDPIVHRANEGENFIVWNIDNDMDLEVWANGYINEVISPGSYNTLTWHNAYNYYLRYENQGWMLVGTSAGTWNRMTRGKNYEIDIPETLYVTEGSSPLITFHNEFVRATGENLDALDNDLERIFSIPGGESQSVEIDEMDGAVILHNPTEKFFVGVPSDNYAISGSTPIANYWPDIVEMTEYTDIYIYPARVSHVVWNGTLAQGEICYSLSLGDMLETTDWYPIEPGYKLSVYQGQDFTFRSSARFQAVYNNQVVQASFEGQNRHNPLYNYYYIQVEGFQYDLKIEPYGAGAEGEGEDAGFALTSTLALIATAFSAILPILNIQVFGGITIGFLALIPLTMGIIVMIFKLIKK